MQNEIEIVIKSALTQAWGSQKDSCYWWYATYLGSFYSSQYYLAQRFLNRQNNTLFNCEKLKEILLSTQQTDGGWQQITDPSNKTSNIDVTIFNYWFLKASKSLEITEEPMNKARQFILKNGGLQAANFFTKTWLCLFGNYEWNEIPSIPLFPFRDDSIYKLSFIKPLVAQWVYPHVLPMAYLRHFKTQKFLGDEFVLSELDNVKTAVKVVVQGFKKQKTSASKKVRNLVEKIQETRRPCGTFGAYGGSTLFALFVQQDWNERFLNEDIKFGEKDFVDALKIVEEFYFNNGENSYLGIYNDGRWWETLLMSIAMLECGEEKEKFMNVIGNLFGKAVQSNGAMAYGLDFELSTDADSTSMWITLLAKYFRNECWVGILRANEWLIGMQNKDGGFGAFAKGVNETLLVKKFANDFKNCGEFFDESSADVTAHVLEAWAHVGFTLDDKHVRNAVDFLKRKQTHFGAWEGRWGVNYIYGVGAAVPAIAKIPGADLLQMKWVLKSIDWLVSIQNEDGGFGESTLSYVDEKWIGKGVSTPSQTAWAILALIEAEKVGYSVTESLKKAVKYLLGSFLVDQGKWVDDSSVGTGHRKSVYMYYPVYSICWPMIALARYRELNNANR